MPDPSKKLRKHAADDLAGEELLAGTLVQPPGSMTRNVSKGVGGVIGAVIAEKATAGDDEEPQGIAASLPEESQMWIGLTATRLLFWKHGMMGGKPKELITTVPRSDVLSLATEKGKLATRATLRFSDNSEWAFEIPRMNDPKGFAAAVHAAGISDGDLSGGASF